MPLAAWPGACATSDKAEATLSGEFGTSSNPQNNPNNEDGVCILHNCQSDAECATCSDGRTSCNLEENRCIACDPQGDSSCRSGEYCSPYGQCVPDGVTCPTDGKGTPKITCREDDDCLACDPMHRVCDTKNKRCVACTPEDTSECRSTDVCIRNECTPKCPASCNRDDDCAQCGKPGHEAHACNAHKCAECSATKPCPEGERCSPKGVCEAQCGAKDKGTCQTDADCHGCRANNDVCHVPINGGEGTCGPEADGCSDLGEGALVLPEPWSQVTNLCSEDNDCNGVGIQLNVGKILREITGFDDIDDANVDYGMNVCASVSVGSGTHQVSCGVCVPCRVDKDCNDIDIDDVAGDAFGPIGGIAAALLLDSIFGDNAHTVHMYCEGVAGDYGVCVPCPGILYDCGVGTGWGSDPQGSEGTCDHDVCDGGGALDYYCDDCTMAVCDVDDFCCLEEWDDQCAEEVALYCDFSCEPGECNHDVCEAGGPLDRSCDECVGSVCDEDDYCCTTEWDDTCVEEVADYCGFSCGGDECHDECTVGGALDASCTDCAAIVCAQDEFCCGTSWDEQCVANVDEYCDFTCGATGTCESPSECPWPEGCLIDNTCGACQVDEDCYPDLCDANTGECYQTE